MQKIVLLMAVMLAVLGSTVVKGEEKAAETAVAAATADAKVETEAVVKDMSAAALKVNGKVITEGDIEEGVKQQLASRSKAVSDEKMLERYRQMLRPRVIDSIINVELISQAAQKEGLALTDEDIQLRLKDIVDIAMEQSGMTREDLEKDIMKRQGVTIEESLNQYKKNKQFLDTILLEKVAAVKYPQEIAVSDDDIQKYYDDNKEPRYSKPEKVRASHILVKTLDDEGKPYDEAAKAEALKKIEDIQKKVAEPDADFARLAEEYSDCPSGKRSGGDLNFFPRTGAMVEPFAEAAFKLKPGEVSDIVETRFGYHIIKCTDRQAEEITKLADVKDDIRKLLERNKKSEVLSKLTKELRDQAKIEYVNEDDDPAVKAAKAEERKKAAQEAAEKAKAEEKVNN